ncbi:hypothetical protein PENSTE_c009G02557 [Penicillium steckii]|uniref:NAD(P)-binding domain-containing protein n=1 Tax=Penicillium steckii TaxID=303698 RepID=A0A1V6TBN1_9EURO|nr:hypothetical protein PENSTE_c009G02557 [Penicillium steckii]
MTHSIKNVAIAGASGNLGSQILAALLRNKQFNVTVLSRSARSFPADVQVKPVDFASLDELTTALVGQDAVIDSTSSPEVETPVRLIEAAAQAGVYRFITSDFGLDPDLAGVHELPVFARKKASYEACLSTGFAGLNFREKKAWLFGDGNNVHPWTTLKDVGQATANILLRPQETLNRPVYIHSVFVSQSQLFDMAKEVTGGDWTVMYNDMELLLQRALEDLRVGRISDATFGVQIQYCLANKALAHPWKLDDNQLVGLEEWDLEKVKGLIRGIAN